MRNFFCSLLIFLGFVLSIIGAMWVSKGSDTSTGVTILIVGVVLFILGILLSKYKNAKTKKGIIGFFVSLLIIVFIMGAIIPTEEQKKQREIEKSEAWKTKDNSVMADIMMRDYVKKELKSPSTAKFASATEKAARVIIKMDNYVYYVKSFVDSENSFGATIRTHYHGEIKQISDDKWKLISLEFED